MSIQIRVENLSRHFGGLKAVDDVTFEVQAGTKAGLIGPNGAGKTTLFNLISQVLEPTSGRVSYSGRTANGIGDCSALGVARTFQTPRGFPSLSVVQNIEVMYDDPRSSLAGALFRWGSAKQRRERAMTVLETVGLQRHADSSYEKLSGGDLRMLEIGRQIARDPKLLLLDEPTAGLDRGHQDRLSGLITRLNDDGVTVLLVEHNLRFLFENVEQVHVMSAGRLIASGNPTDVANDDAVKTAYLGRTDSDADLHA